MHRLGRSFLLPGVMTLDLALAGVAILMAAGEPPEALWSARIGLGQALAALAAAGFTHGVFRQAGLYRSQRLGSLRRLYQRIAVAAGAPALAAAATGWVQWPAAAAVWVGTALAIIAARALVYQGLEALRRRGRNLRYVVVVGAGARGRRFAAELEGRVELGCRVLGFLDESPPAGEPDRWLGGLDRLAGLLESGQVDEVAVALPIKTFYAALARIVTLCEERGVVVRVPGDLFDAPLARVESEQFEDLSILTIFTGRGSPLSMLVKRMVDLAVSAAALAALAPLLALIALAVRLDSPGPVLFRQVRVGHNRRRFRVWKFRTMTADAEARQPELEARNQVRGAAFKIHDDPRVTRLGRGLRRASLDELPQLVNVLRGQMSLVGPRPLPVRDVERLSQDWQRRRFSVRPGLTCLWQSGGRHRLAFDEWMRLDLDYIDNWSLLLDLKILLRTVPALWSGAGAS